MTQHIKIPMWHIAKVFAFTVGLSVPAFAGDIADCNQSADPALQIKGCTGFIGTDPNPNHLAIAYANRGIAHNALDDVTQAIADFTTAIGANPDYAIAYYNRGIAYTVNGDLNEAVADFNTSLSLSPNDPDAYDARGNAYFDLRDYIKANENFTKAIELDPTFAAAYYHRSLLFSATGHLESGLADYNKALELGCLRQGWCPAR